MKPVMTRWKYPQTIESQVNRNLSIAVTELISAMRESATRLKIDTAEELEEEDGYLDGIIAALVASFISTIPAIGAAIYRYNSSQFLILAIKTGGRSNPSVLDLEVNGINGDEPWYNDDLNQWIYTTDKSTRKLLNNIKDDFLQTAATIQNGDYVKLSDRYKTYRKRTANIASGIVSSLNSTLMRRRLEDAGVSRYIWHGMLDERERLTHIKKEGVSFSLDGDDFFPGQEYGCRCWAVPDWESQ